jgi:hypothetical protein
MWQRRQKTQSSRLTSVGLAAREESELRGDIIERDIAGHLDERLDLGAAQCDGTASFECPVEQK